MTLYLCRGPGRPPCHILICRKHSMCHYRFIFIWGSIFIDTFFHIYTKQLLKKLQHKMHADAYFRRHVPLRAALSPLYACLSMLRFSFQASLILMARGRRAANMMMRWLLPPATGARPQVLTLMMTLFRLLSLIIELLARFLLSLNTSFKYQPQSYAAVRPLPSTRAAAERAFRRLDIYDDYLRLAHFSNAYAFMLHATDTLRGFLYQRFGFRDTR